MSIDSLIRNMLRLMRRRAGAGAGGTECGPRRGAVRASNGAAGREVAAALVRENLGAAGAADPPAAADPVVLREARVTAHKTLGCNGLAICPNCPNMQRYITVI